MANACDIQINIYCGSRHESSLTDTPTWMERHCWRREHTLGRSSMGSAKGM